MKIRTSNSYTRLEHWLVLLIANYRLQPSLSLLKAINYYIERLIQHEDSYLYSQHNDYIRMQKYWRWLKKAHY